MYRIILLFFFAIALTCTNQVRAQSATDEFVSIAGQFAIKLPTTYSNYKQFVAYEVSGQKFNGGMYQWQLGDGQASVIHATGAINLESPAIAEAYLKAIRDDYSKRTADGSLIGEKKTSLDGHPGLISVFQSDVGRTMVWVYLVKNRFYTMSLTLNDTAKIEQNINTISTFRLVSSTELEPRYAKLVEQMTPQPLPQESNKSKSTSDIQNLGLKGKVRRIVTETEPYFGSELIGARYLLSDENFNEGGDLTRGVVYTGGLPESVRVYGYTKEGRVYREERKDRTVVFETSNTKDKAIDPSTVPQNDTKIELFELKYRYDGPGKLSEMRLINEDGKEEEKYSFTSGKIEHTYYARIGVNILDKVFLNPKNIIKDSSSIDTNGNVTETTRTFRDLLNEKTEYVSIDGKVQPVTHEQYKTEFYKYRYEFDDKGNWIRRITILVEKNKDSVVETPKYVTHRTVFYY